MKKFIEISSINEVVKDSLDMRKELEKVFKKNFPKSWYQIGDTNLKNPNSTKKDISIRYTIGAKSDWANGILQNDPFFTTMHVWDMVDGEDFSKTKLKMEMGTGNRTSVDATTTPSIVVKIGWRNKTATPDNLLKHFDNYLKKTKEVAKKHLDTLPGYVAGQL